MEPLKNPCSSEIIASNRNWIGGNHWFKKVAGDGSFQALDADYPIDEAYWPGWIKGEVERYHRYRS